MHSGTEDTNPGELDAGSLGKFCFVYNLLPVLGASDVEGQRRELVRFVLVLDKHFSCNCCPSEMRC